MHRRSLASVDTMINRRRNTGESGSNRWNMSATMKEPSSMQFPPPDVDEKAASYLRNLDDNIRQMEDMMVELNGGLMKFKSGIPVLRESFQTKQVLGQDFTKEIIEHNAKKIAEAVERGERLEEENQSFLMELSKLQQSTEKKESEISTLSEKLKKTEQELKNTQTRLSEVMGNKLLDNNPDIADLSDKHRPSKLAEKYSELYDNEWTDAFEAIQPALTFDDKKCVTTLKSLLLYINRLCREKWQDYVHGFNHNIKRGQNFEVPDYINKQLKDITKLFAPRMVNDVFKEIIQESSNLQGTRWTLIQLKGVQTFINVCVELCWLMAAQDPPVFLKTDHEPGDKMDTNVFKAYTQNGETIEYVVWPPLFLNENGPLLTKGVAQANRSRRAKSAPAKSSGNPRGTDNLPSSTKLITLKTDKGVIEEPSPITNQPQTNNQMETEDTQQSPASVHGNQHYQQTNVSTSLQMQTQSSSTSQYNMRPGDYAFGNLPVTNIISSNADGQQFKHEQTRSDEKQMRDNNQIISGVSHPPTPYQQQQHQYHWKHGRFPTQNEWNEYNRCIFLKHYNEDNTITILGKHVFEICRDYHQYHYNQVMAGAQVHPLV